MSSLSFPMTWKLICMIHVRQTSPKQKGKKVVKNAVARNTSQSKMKTVLLLSHSNLCTRQGTIKDVEPYKRAHFFSFPVRRNAVQSNPAIKDAVGSRKSVRITVCLGWDQENFRNKIINIVWLLLVP